ncbi:UDP-N-acetylmuramoyl-L-alanyl-D-glutamate--2,6-diaminopimelate ligase [Pullulanibacillus pueri]|uniref:UDP-N-acetylmuramoyl-L-alanyl-D-glutamate--2,6-diaminopimelate ligase n=1 Tax=Pullulanibacillus pueri TaxID=1437324 RepID=A0A8J2ZSM2_9BACL|nr:UDP-N-acetylmuramoyl-L-alanyl-D-glutamate--2,6-diaminopimelate ligase [Pullulanibacillus pueri]MBM7680130.1 UDP-N-acetylmuramoyl-L-alanyl-D-glutamate--2,6-diaminopimelate ligase [Pullulanibacillus pueri]GGH74497.1 UDP-N-acetylmuramoyl-L-alanyl-D-glutamate--2,6-diaminopimelate ligase [Pullulanibacillus pueri]
MKLNQLLTTLGSYRRENEGDPDISSIEMDSRQVQPGSLFVCVKGERFDGHQFVEEVQAKGAVALVAERPISADIPVVYVSEARRAMGMLVDTFYGQPTHQLSLIGVTGTNGKTTITHLVRQIQEAANIKTGIVGTMGIKFGQQEISVSNTTPEAPVLQKAFRTMVDYDIQSAVMEVSSHALVQGRVRGLDFDIAVFTNLTQDHLDYHGTMKDYLHAKSLLFSQLGNTYDSERKKVAVINNDDAAAETLKQATAVSILTYGIDQPADVQAQNIKVTAKGTQFDLKTPDGTFSVSMKLVGKFSVYNILAAACVCHLNGINWERMIESIKDIEGVSGRFETVEAGQNFSVIVDYSHTPDSLENALLTIKEFAKGRVITVVGCGGDRDRTKRPLMAEIAVKYSDLAVFTSDNPRTEDPERILEDMVKGLDKGTYTKLTGRREAITYAVNQAADHDVVLIAGKGHETYQIIGTEVLDFDDRVEARQAIKERLADGN